MGIIEFVMLRKGLFLGLIASMGLTGAIEAQGSKFGEIVKVSYKGYGDSKIFEAYLLQPSGVIWKFNSQSPEVLSYLASYVIVNFVQPHGPYGKAFDGATTPNSAINIKAVKNIKLKKVYEMPEHEITYWVNKGYNYSRGFRCGKLQMVASKDFKIGWFSHAKGVQIELAVSGVNGTIAEECKMDDDMLICNPYIWKATLPSSKKQTYFEEIGNDKNIRKKGTLYDILVKELGNYICIEYIQRIPDKNDPFNYRAIGVFELNK